MNKNLAIPFFSIVTPSFNQGRYLATCLESVRGQGIADYEHIIIDNCSTDETKTILTEWSHDRHLKIIVESDHGQSEAVNKGLRLAQGEIICWLNSDDAYLSLNSTEAANNCVASVLASYDTLSRCAPSAPCSSLASANFKKGTNRASTFQILREVFRNPEVDVVFGDALQIFDGEKIPPQRAVSMFSNRNDFIRWWTSRIKLHQPAIFFRRSVVESIGLLNEQLHYAMDYEYWWRMSERYQFHYIPEVLAIQHRQPDSKTIKAWDRVLEEREKIFSPHYALLNEKKTDLEKEKSVTLARHYLLQAYSVVEKDRAIASTYLKKAWNQSPYEVCKKSSWGLLKNLFFGNR